MNQLIKKNRKFLNEDIIINKYLKKLCFSKKTTFNFENDAGILKVPKNKEIVVSQDTLVEKIHFFSNDSPESIALKSIRTNLSDLTSMGARPYAYTMSLSLNNNINKSWINKFSNSLYREQKKYDFYLLGGDIVKSKYISVSITIFGIVNKGNYISRNGANLRDDIWVTGNICDSFIGYKVLKNKLSIKNIKIKNYFLNSYFYPKPPVVLAIKLSKLMTSAIDISDGFLSDFEKLILNNDKGAFINPHLIPFSQNTKNLLIKSAISIVDLLTAGDDYQLIFTSNKLNRNKIIKLSKNCNCKTTRIGEINNTKILDFNGYNFKETKKGFTHII